MTDGGNKKPNRAKGALAVAAKMTPEQKAARARKGALARWGAQSLKATHKGNFRDEFGLDVECYVLNDAGKTAVISQRGMGGALGLGEGGSKLPRLVSGKVLSQYVGPELREKLENPLIFQAPPAGPGLPSVQASGYDVTVLTDLCRAILRADSEGKLQRNQDRIARQAGIIVGAAANAGITGLVYALAGYRPEVDEVIQAFKAFIQEEAKKYEAEFPNELYMAWQQLYKVPMPGRGKPWQFMHLTRRHIYYPLAKSQGKLLELLKALRAKDGEQKRYLFQFLNDIGARALRIHIGRILEMAESANGDAAAYESKFNERFGDQGELEFVPKG